uniref:Peptidase S1 domain-containing protein n=1 Tax=Pygocentrus nattereri TaxID=42514 RepID=A0AAR2KWG7_PYGNA
MIGEKLLFVITSCFYYKHCVTPLSRTPLLSNDFDSCRRHSSHLNTCGRPAIPPMVNARIVNGEAAKAHSWPWQVSMQSQPTPTFAHTCGGTLIHRHWVMTAAHCFIRWQMCLGKHNLTLSEPGQQCFGVQGIYRHKGFNYPTSPTVEFDIALVRLDGEVTPSDHVHFACLPPIEEVLPEGKTCYATGWGDETAPKASETLNQVALPVVPYDTCKRMDYWWFQVKSSMICAGYNLPDELKSVCQGDSGGPLVCQDGPTGPWEVHGITSFGPIGCIMNKKPSVFTRTSFRIHFGLLTDLDLKLNKRPKAFCFE